MSRIQTWLSIPAVLLLFCVPRTTLAGPIILHAGDSVLYTMDFSGLDMTDAFWFDFNLQVSPLPGDTATGYTESWEYTEDFLGGGTGGPLVNTSFETVMSLGSVGHPLVSTAFLDYQLIDVAGSATNRLLYSFDVSVRSLNDEFLGNADITAVVSSVPSPGSALLTLLGLTVLTLQMGDGNRRQKYLFEDTAGYGRANL